MSGWGECMADDRIFGVRRAAARLGVAAGVAAAMTGCAALPGGDLAERAAVERFLIQAPEGDGFANAQAAAFHMMARAAAAEDSHRRLAAAYYRKAQAAKAGDFAPPWSPADFGVVNPRLEAARAQTEDAVAQHSDARPTACAMAVARYDGWLNVVAEGGGDAAPEALVEGAWLIALHQCAGGASASAVGLAGAEGGAVDALFAAVGAPRTEPEPRDPRGGE